MRLPPEKVRDTWTTPDWLLNYAEFLLGRPFDLDVCASRGNAVAPRYFTRKDPLMRPDTRGTLAWSRSAGQLNIGRGPYSLPAPWMNPPFSTPNLPLFVHAFIRAHQHNLFPRGACMTLGDITTSYWAELSTVAYQVPIIGRWGCDPPRGVEKSTPRAPMALWLFGKVGDCDYIEPRPTHWQELAARFGQRRKRY